MTFEPLDPPNSEPPPKPGKAAEPGSAPHPGMLPERGVWLRPGGAAGDPAERHEAAPPPASVPGPVKGPVPWKAAASSIPRLREQPAELPAPGAADAFPGFAQDRLTAHAPNALERAAATAEAVPDDQAVPATSPLLVEPPFWERWLDRLRLIPAPVALGAVFGLLLVVAVAFTILPREEHVPLARLRQQPEAFDGRIVNVHGRAGETFTIGGSYVFNLRQGRDTIVVYSRTRRPLRNQKIKATGTVSIGYLDGRPRVALFEDTPPP